MPEFADIAVGGQSAGATAVVNLLINCDSSSIPPAVENAAKLDKALRALLPTVKEVKQEWQAWQRSVTISQRWLTQYAEKNNEVARSVKNLTAHMGAGEQAVTKFGRATRESLGSIPSLTAAASQGWGMLIAKLAAGYAILKTLRESFHARLDVAQIGGVGVYEQVAQQARQSGLNVGKLSSTYGAYLGMGPQAQFGGVGPEAFAQIQKQLLPLGQERAGALTTSLLGSMAPQEQAAFLQNVQKQGLEQALKGAANVSNIGQVSSMLNAVQISKQAEAGKLSPELQGALKAAEAVDKFTTAIESATDMIVGKLAPSITSIANLIGGMSPTGLIGGAAGLWAGKKLLGSGLGIAARGLGGLFGAGGAAGTAGGGAGLWAGGMAPPLLAIAGGAALGYTAGTAIDQNIVKPYQEAGYEREQDRLNKEVMEQTDRMIAAKRGMSLADYRSWKQGRRKQAQQQVTPPQIPAAVNAQTVGQSKGVPDDVARLQQEAKALDQLEREAHITQLNISLTKSLAEAERWRYGFSKESGATLLRQIGEEIRLTEKRLEIAKRDTSEAGRAKAAQIASELQAQRLERERTKENLPRERFVASQSLENARLQVEHSRLAMMKSGILGGVASPAQTLAVADALSNKAESLRKEYERLASLKDRTQEQTLQMYQAETEINQTIAERRSLMREYERGALDAIQAQAMGAGKFEKYLVTQDRNVNRAADRNMISRMNQLYVGGYSPGAGAPLVKPFQFAPSLNENVRGFSDYAAQLQDQYQRIRGPVQNYAPIVPQSAERLAAQTQNISKGFAPEAPQRRADTRGSANYSANPGAGLKDELRIAGQALLSASRRVEAGTTAPREGMQSLRGNQVSPL